MTSRNRKLRILYIVSIMPPYQGGAATDYSSFVKTLGSDRFSGVVESITVLTERGCAINYGPRVRIKDSLTNYDTAENKSFFAQLVNYMRIILHVLFGGYDVVHIHARYVYARHIGRLVWLALVLTRSASVVDLRDRFYNGFGFAVHFIACSDALREYYSWIKNVRCVPVPLELPDAGEVKGEGRNLAYFGNIAENKGVMELVEGFDRYRKECRGLVELHLYGANAMGEDFLCAIKGRVGVRYMGVVDGGEVLKRISGYRAVVLPSKSEGMPRVCLETIYCGRPIVCHRNIKSILPCIPDNFVLDDLTPGEFSRVFKNVEKVSGPVEYGYDFSVHGPLSVGSELLACYGGLFAPGRVATDKGGARLIKRRG